MDEALAKLTCEWLTKALHDLQTARITANRRTARSTPPSTTASKQRKNP